MRNGHDAWHLLQWKILNGKAYHPLQCLLTFHITRIKLGDDLDTTPLSTTANNFHNFHSKIFIRKTWNSISWAKFYSK